MIYVATLGDRVYVLHAFHKKSKTGIATPQDELELASKRYRQLKCVRWTYHPCDATSQW